VQPLGCNATRLVGLSRRLGTRGAVRLDGVYRKFHDFYVTRVDTTTGRVADQFGKPFDLGLVENNNDVLSRKYRGINLQASYRPDARLGFGGNYTLGELKGNTEGETGPSGPVTSAVLQYPEYLDRSWNAPEGNLNEDIRHKVRLWATYDVPVPATLGSITLGALEFYGRAEPSSEIGGEVRVIATGGLASLIATGSEFIEMVDDTLTLEGLRLVYERTQQHSV